MTAVRASLRFGYIWLYLLLYLLGAEHGVGLPGAGGAVAEAGGVPSALQHKVHQGAHRGLVHLARGKSRVSESDPYRKALRTTGGAMGTTVGEAFGEPRFAVRTGTMQEAVSNSNSKRGRS
eukprot:1190737-Prorocentrum_minimum.AAC.6